MPAASVFGTRSETGRKLRLVRSLPQTWPPPSLPTPKFRADLPRLLVTQLFSHAHLYVVEFSVKFTVYHLSTS